MKKKQFRIVSGFIEIWRSKLLLTMKLTLIALCITVFQGFALITYGQNAKINLKMENVSIKQVLNSIEDQTNFFFIYNGTLVDVERKVNVDVDNQNINDVLKEIFSGTNIKYEIENRQILLSNVKEISGSGSQQQKSVTGKVTDSSGASLPGVSVVVKGTTVGTITDTDGNYKLANVPTNATLVFSFVGMETQEIKVGSQTNINITLKDQTVGIEEVVAIGYGTQKKANLSGAVSQVDMDKVLGDRPVVSVGNALQGTIPGLVVNTPAQPGSASTFNIRGITSINGGSPLILVDNVPASIELINPEDIESVSVLKDAASTAIYGARGAFGIMLITTKKVKKDAKLSINYNNNFGIESPLNMPEQLPVVDWMNQWQATFGDTYYIQSMDMNKWRNLWNKYREDPTSFSGIEESGRYIDPDGKTYFLKESDIMRSAMDNYGFQQIHNVSAEGGSDKIMFRISFGYLSNDGILIGSKDMYKRVNTSAYLNANITSWLSTSLDIKYAKGNRLSPRAKSLWNSALVNFWPTGTVIDKEGNLQYWNTPENDIHLATTDKTINQNPRIFSRTSIRPVKGLEAIFEYTYDNNHYDYKSYTGNYMLMHPQDAKISLPNTPQYFDNKSSSDYNSINAYATYNTDINKIHNIKIMAGFSQETSWTEDMNVNRLDMINPDMPSISGGIGEIKATDAFSEYVIRGGFFRLNYDYKNKYLLEVNGRYDGSSKFPQNNRFGFFPSASLGWQLAQERFMDWSKPWMNEFKLRASIGQVGNQAIGNYQYISQMPSYLSNWIIDKKRPTTLTTPGMISSNFTWEVVENIDLGADFSLFNSKLQATFDWYVRGTKGMLTSGAQFAAEVGTTAPLQNAADLRNEGWEFTANWRQKVAKIGYNVGFNIYDSKAKITKYANVNNLLSDRYVGQSINEIWGYVSDGFYTIDDFVSSEVNVKGWQDGVWNLKSGIPSILGVTVKPGDCKFVNLHDSDVSQNRIDTGDNTLTNPGDRKVIGNSTPRFQFGINGGLSWKGFDLSIFLQGTGKRDYWISDGVRWPFGGGGTNGVLFKGQDDYWQPKEVNAKTAEGWAPVNSNPTYFRMYENFGNGGSNMRVSTKYLSNAAYVRLKNLTLSYSFPGNINKRIGVSALKVFFSGENLLTFDRLPSGFDPERLSWSYPYYRTMSLGLSLTL